MKLETKRRIKALFGYPITFLFAPLDKTEAQKKETKEAREMFKARIMGKRLL